MLGDEPGVPPGGLPGVCIHTFKIPVAIVAAAVALSRVPSGVNTSPPTPPIHMAE
jgi:hypothetical protein